MKDTQNGGQLYVNDIRNKLSPITHLISMIEIGRLDLAQQGLEQAKKSVNYLAKRNVYQDDISIQWWNSLKYVARNKLSQKYFSKSEPISLHEIKDIYTKEKDNVDHWTNPESIN